MNDDDALCTWTIYDHPSDYPHCFVAREWRVTAAGLTPGEEIVAPELDMLRAFLRARGLVCLTRSPEDDPKLVETWL